MNTYQVRRGGVCLLAALGVAALAAGPVWSADDAKTQHTEIVSLKKELAELQRYVRKLETRLDAQEAAQTQGNRPAPSLPAPILSGDARAQASVGAPAATGTAASAATGPADSSTSSGGMSADERAKMEAEFAKELGGAKGAAQPAVTSAKAAAEAAPTQPGAATTKAALKLPSNFLSGSTPTTVSSGGAGAGALKLVDVSVSLLNDLGASTAGEGQLRRLMAGDHDPRNNGFTAPNEEFVFSGIVDHHFKGDLVTVTKINTLGDTELEIEEAHLDTLDLGHGLQARGGLFFTDFGRLNNSHPHTWDFATAPVIFTRLMGSDGQRAPGARIGWILPTKKYNKLYFAGQQPTGSGTMHSFRAGLNDGSGTDEYNQIGGHAFPVAPNDLGQVRSPFDLVYSLRFETEREPSDALTLVPGVSFSTGPNASGPGASGASVPGAHYIDTRTQLYGLDLYTKWKPLNNDHGFPFWTTQTELFLRSYEAAPGPDYRSYLSGGAGAAFAALPGEVLHDWGFYTQVVHGFKRDWTAGLRLDYADGSGKESSTDPFRDRRWRLTPNITHYYSHFSKLRFELDIDRAEHLSNHAQATAVAQYEVNFGAHGAHTF